MFALAAASIFVRTMPYNQWEDCMKVDRRRFAAVTGLAGMAALLPGSQVLAAPTSSRIPWYRRVRRWSQLNFTAEDITDMDLSFWREYWQATRTQGVILTAGGHVAFYPSEVPDQRVAPQLNGRDFFGEVARAAREDGMEVVARLSLRGSQELLAKHPEWAARDVAGKPTQQACMNGGYFYDYGAAIVREVGRRYKPSGFTLSGWGASYALCYCDVCTTLFRTATGREVPRARNWDDPVYRRWMEWNDERVIALWDYSNRVAREAGGPDCLWVGQFVGSTPYRNMKALTERSPFTMSDHQTAEDESGLAESSAYVKAVQGLSNWEKPAAVATAFYGPRLNSPAPAQTAMWMYGGMAAGAAQWWNIIGAYSEDKARFAILPPLLQWHERNEAYLFNRRPLANVGMMWSDTNNIFYGRESFEGRVVEPYRGMVDALTRARIPFRPVHIDQLDRDAKELACIILPDLAAMSDEQIAAVVRFAKRGGGVLATGNTSLCDRYGTPRKDYGLAQLFGASSPGATLVRETPGMSKDMAHQMQSKIMLDGGIYFAESAVKGIGAPQSLLRLLPSLRRAAYGPHRADEPPVRPGETRHPALSGFSQTDLMYFGGALRPTQVSADAQVLLTYVPAVRNQNPEDVVFEVKQTDVPGLVVRETGEGARIAFLPADLDRRFAVEHVPAHGDLIANLVRWTARDQMPVVIEGEGLFDCNAYWQPSRIILHVSNLNNPGNWRPPVEQPVAVGPLDVSLRLLPGMQGGSGRLLVSDKTVPVTIANGRATVRIPSIKMHEVLVIE